MLELMESSDRFEKEENALPIGELQPLPSPPASVPARACSFFSRSA